MMPLRGLAHSFADPNQGHLVIGDMRWHFGINQESC